MHDKINLSGTMTANEAVELLKSAASKWTFYNAPRLGAALAYYALLSFAPLLILLVTLCALAFNEAAAEQDLIAYAQDFVGPAQAQTIKTFIDSAHHATTGVVATAIALATLFFGASGVFVELRDSLNLIWNSPQPKASAAWRGFLLQRLISFLMILALGSLLFVSLLLSTILGMARKVVTLRPLANSSRFHIAFLSEIGSHLVSLVAVAILFALIFKFVPTVRLRWRDVVAGAALTAILFEFGKALLAFYIATAGVGSAYGAAGSLIALVVWVYYSAQIFFFGASFTCVYADTHGSRPRRAR